MEQYIAFATFTDDLEGPYATLFEAKDDDRAKTMGVEISEAVFKTCINEFGFVGDISVHKVDHVDGPHEGLDGEGSVIIMDDPDNADMQRAWYGVSPDETMAVFERQPIQKNLKLYPAGF